MQINKFPHKNKKAKIKNNKQTKNLNKKKKVCNTT